MFSFSLIQRASGFPPEMQFLAVLGSCFRFVVVTIGIPNFGSKLFWRYPIETRYGILKQHLAIVEGYILTCPKFSRFCL